jgi:flagellar biosynthesis/type III secretory pathway protein FliH
MKITRYIFPDFNQLQEAAKHEEPSPEVVVRNDEIEATPIEPTIEQQEEVEDRGATVTQEDLIVSRAEGYEEGYNKARQEFDQKSLELNQRLALIEEKIADSLSSYIAQKQQLEISFTQYATKLAAHIAYKLATKALKEDPYSTLYPLIEKTLIVLIKEPELTINLHPDVIDEVKEKVSIINSKTKFPGKISFRANEQIEVYDCNIEWQDGYIGSNKENSFEDIMRIIDEE